METLAQLINFEQIGLQELLLLIGSAVGLLVILVVLGRIIFAKSITVMHVVLIGFGIAMLALPVAKEIEIDGEGIRIIKQEANENTAAVNARLGLVETQLKQIEVFVNDVNASIDELSAMQVAALSSSSTRMQRPVALGLSKSVEPTSAEAPSDQTERLSARAQRGPASVEAPSSSELSIASGPTVAASDSVVDYNPTPRLELAAPDKEILIFYRTERTNDAEALVAALRDDGYLVGSSPSDLSEISEPLDPGLQMVLNKTLNEAGIAKVSTALSQVIPGSGLTVKDAREGSRGDAQILLF